MREKQWIMNLREWQAQAFVQYDASTAQSFLCCATPGAGKTMFAARVAHYRLSDDVEQVIVVCPSVNLREQWKASMNDNGGIQIKPDYEPYQGVPPSDLDGIAVTYAAVASNPDCYRALVARKRTLVILDEIHHCGDSRAWGDSVKHAFENAPYILGLSGTPFRQDNNPIPFVRYENNVARPDYRYSYGQAVADKACRPIMFPTFEGSVQWLEYGELVERDFADNVEDKEAEKLLRAALTTDWVDSVIEKAKEQLDDIRSNGHPNAGGLVLAMNADHARDIASKIPGCDVVLYDEPGASETLAKWNKGNGKWLVSVRMVSEGVDIPRLRVLVYATNYCTELFFRQAIARVARVQRDIEDSQVAYCFMPADERLVRFALDVKKERDHGLTEQAERAEREYREGGERNPAVWRPLDGAARDGDIIFNGQLYDNREYARYAAIADAARRNGLNVDAATVMALAPYIHAAPADAVLPVSEPAVSDIHKKLRKLCTDFVSIVARRESERTGDSDMYRKINARANQLTGVRSVNEANADQLQKRLTILKDWHKNGYC